MLDREDPEGVRLLLAAGMELQDSLTWAVWRGRSAAIIEMLLDAGAEIDAKWKYGRTAYALAKVSGQEEVAALLASRGASTEIPPLSTPGSEALLADLTSSHFSGAVRQLLADGIPVNSRGQHGATALHWACWKGYADLVELLLAHGASLTLEDEQYHATPAGWFDHGRRNCGEGDYPAVERLLLAAGATIPPG